MPAPRRWVKLFCYERIHGSVAFQLTESEQSIWDKLLCLAGLCGHEGLIADHDRRPYPHSFIVHELHTTETLFNSTLRKCITEGRLSEDGEGIKITNWDKYQSEYSRQKPYREAQAFADQSGTPDEAQLTEQYRSGVIDASEFVKRRKELKRHYENR